MTPAKRKVLPMIVLTFGMLGGIGLVTVRPGVSTEAAEPRLRLMRVAPLDPTTIELVVEAQGSVVPRTEAELVAEVSGRVLAVSPSLGDGGFFDAGETLVEIDPSDHRIAVERAGADLARAQSELDLARTTRERQDSLSESGVASPAALDRARSAERVAAAVVRSASAVLAQAKRDLERAHVVAPFAGRVREQRVDVGQFVSRGTLLARLHAIDYAEVRLPLSDEDAAFVDLPLGYRSKGDASAAGPEVSLHGRFAGRDYSWTGHIVRTEGEIDPRTRMIHAVARVEDPYGRGADADRPPLAVGMFVDATLRGRRLEGVYTAPRLALRGASDLVVVDADDRLRLRTVDVVRRERDRVILRSGILPGDRVCLTPLDVVLEGQQVRTDETRAAPAAHAALPRERAIP